MALELLDVGSRQVDGRYWARLDLRVDAPAARVRALLTDYDHFDHLDPTILESRVIARPDAFHLRVRLRARMCFVLVFCFTKTQIHDGVLGADVVCSRIVPDGSDFSYGWVRWRFVAEGAATRVHFETEVEPAFWVPPLIGRIAIERTLTDKTIQVMETVENLAQSGGGVPDPPAAITGGPSGAACGELHATPGPASTAERPDPD